MITSLGANPWRTPAFETAPWLRQKRYKKLATRASRPIQRDPQSQAAPPAGAALLRPTTKGSAAKAKPKFVEEDVGHLRQRDRTDARKYPRSIRNGKASISIDVASPCDKLDSAADIALARGGLRA